MTEVLAIVPARSGSKSVPDKNALVLEGRPMLVHAVEQAVATPSITRTIVSTDSERYAEMARGAGAGVPFIRPSDIAGDLSTDLEVFRHALEWLRDQEGYEPDVVVHLRPTHPIRMPADIESMIRLLLDDPSLDSVRSVVQEPHSPLKSWFRDVDGMLRPAGRSDLDEPFNLPRQMLPPAYRQNGAIDVVRPSVILSGSMTGERIYGYLMDDDFDIDSWDDLARVETVMRLATVVAAPTGAESTPMVFCFDIDGVLATLVPDNDYGMAEPIRRTIDLVNSLAASGHKIVLHTARGSATGIDWRATTEQQLVSWGVRHDDLVFGKPAADFYVDDRMVSLEDLGRAIAEGRDADGGNGQT